MDRLKRYLRPTRAFSQTLTQDASPARSATEHPQGLDVIIEGSDPIIDIVAIHGLNGHRAKTWTAKNGVHWLRDLLPDDTPRARILCWGYDAKTHSASGTSTLYLYNHALDLVSGLSRKRKLTNALIHSDAARQNAFEHRSIKLSTHGIIFMGTPHRGGNGVQLGRILTNLASLFMEADDRILKNLAKDSEWLQQQLGQYSLISSDFVTKFAYEEYPTPTPLGKSILVVPRESAVVPGQASAESIVIHTNHKNMVKFDSNQDTGYITISEHLTIMLDGAEENIRSRWQSESRANDGECPSQNYIILIANYLARG
ncbi:hypothetical protein FDECE_12338 [Fusarium decemcellulare]|nr:hypothetical protein FDECE_12338 [Fusarium decemcellulare]